MQPNPGVNICLTWVSEGGNFLKPVPCAGVEKKVEVIREMLFCLSEYRLRMKLPVTENGMETSRTDQNTASWLQIVFIGRSPKWTLVRIVTLVAIVFLIRAFILLPIFVKGPSMLPHFQERGVNFINRLAYLHSEPQRGDVVAIRLAGTSVMYMKRIVGLPGETVEFRSGRVFINGKLLDEPYMDFEKYPCDWEIAPEKLGLDQYYVVGDNRTMPEQLHEKGVAERRRIAGRILLCKNLFAFSSRSH